MDLASLRCSRRRFLIAGAGIVAALLVSACGGGDSPDTGNTGAEQLMPTHVVVEAEADDEAPSILTQGAGAAPDSGGDASSAVGTAPETQGSAPLAASAAAGSEPAGGNLTGGSRTSSDEYEVIGGWIELRSCADLVDGWMDPTDVPGYTSDGEYLEPEPLLGQDAVSRYTMSYLLTAEIDPWLLGDVTADDNETNARLAEHLASLVDDDGRFCGLVEADMDQVARLGLPMPTTPPAGSIDEYTVWAKGACDSARKGMAESVVGMEALGDLQMEMDDEAYEEDTETDRWGLYGTMFRAVMIADAIEERSDVPREAQSLHTLLLEMAGVLDTVINTLGAVGPVLDPITEAQIEGGQKRVLELCADIDQAADDLRAQYVGR